MSKVSLLILESSSWAHTCDVWMSARGYKVSISGWSAGISLLQQQDYDLILLDENMWLNNGSAVKGFFQNKYVIIISADYSVEGYRRAIEAGAKGYINKDLDQDAFIREFEKGLRMAGMLPKRGRVLLVDNDPHVRNALKNNLEREGYIIYTASNAEDAQKSIEMYRPHVAVLDIRLKDDDDRLDQSGFDLAQAINARYGHAVKIIGLTGSPVRQTATHAVGVMAGFALKDPKLKVDALVPQIEKAREQLGINMSLDIDYEEPLSLAKLVKTMRFYKDFSRQELETITVELEELIRKLFRRELQVKGYYLSPGRGGSGVVLMRPIVEGTLGQYCVVKFGWRENMVKELKNYNLYVRPFVGHRATQLIDIGEEPVQTLNLAGLKFTFAGMSRENPRDFNTFYRDPVTTEKQIKKSLCYLFNETCGTWYTAKRAWPDQSPDALATVYEAQLSLNWSKRVAILKQLLDGESFHGIALKVHESDNIIVQLGEKSFILPEPIRFIQKYRHTFPVPRFQCRTHGDLNGRNMFVDEDSRVWLIDFFKTRWGVVLRDFGELETAIKFQLLETYDLMILYDFEKALLTPGSFDDPINLAFPLQHVPDLHKAWATITQLRSLAQEKSESSEIKEYYVGLLFYALKLLSWEGTFSIDRDRSPIRRRHVLLSAAMIAYRLQHWGDKWPGWPDH
jgi:DNA-binding response OmpR family regulator